MSAVDNAGRAVRLAEFGITPATSAPTADYSQLAEDGEIPAFLRALPRWLTWRLGQAPSGKPTKVPDQSTLDLSRCRSFEEVCKQLPRAKWWSEQGAGFVTTGGVVVQGKHVLLVDIDACRNPATGELTSWAIEAIALLDHSYTEVSPGGGGLRIIICTSELPRGIKSKVKVDAPAAPGCGSKQPEIQLFGLGPAGYVTITGRRIKASKSGAVPLLNLTALVQRFGMQGEPENTNGVHELTGTGDAPTLEAITKRVQEHEHGQALIDGAWKKVMPTKSASEAFHLLAQWALEAAQGHGEAAKNWLLRHTAWGRGDIDDSADPSRYMRPKWVQADLLRVAKKRTISTPKAAADVFDVESEPEPSSPQSAPADDGKLPPDLGAPSKVIAQWRLDGPIKRLPTGIATLDEVTGGGLVLGSRVYLIGAPDAGKTALVVQIADTYLASGICVGILGVDEEPVDIATRLMQRRGISRADCDERSPAVLARAGEELARLPLLLFDGMVSIERAAEALHRFAQARSPGVDRPPCVLVVDSIQTARAEKEDLDASLYKSVTGRVAQLRRAAARYRMLVIATSEMNRGAYKSKKVDEQTTDMAAAKESGAIEFSARVLLSLRSVPAQSDLVELRVVKNKHGLSHRGDQDGIFLRVDRDQQQLVEDTEFQPIDTDELREAERAKKTEAREVQDAVKLFKLIEARPMTVIALEDALRDLGVARNRTRAARKWLTDVRAITEKEGPKRTTTLVPVRENLPADVLAALAGGAA